MSTTTTSYASKLQHRITELEKRHEQLHDEVEKLQSDPEENYYNAQQIMSYSSTAAFVWNLKCEVEKCLHLYEVEHPTFANNIERDCSYVATCVKSCVNEAQIDTCCKMIEGLNIIHPASVQLSSWQDSLWLEVHKKRRDFAPIGTL